jgi:hypothetical protein
MLLIADWQGLSVQLPFTFRAYGTIFAFRRSRNHLTLQSALDYSARTGLLRIFAPTVGILGLATPVSAQVALAVYGDKLSHFGDALITGQAKSAWSPQELTDDTRTA